MADPTWDETTEITPTWDDTEPVRPKITPSPYEQARLSGMEPVQGPFGPAHPEEV